MSDTAAPTAPAGPNLTDFGCFYLYGLTNQPYRQSTDLGKFGELYSLVIGNHGGLGIASSFHLDDGEHVIGRGQDASVRVDDDSISRKHASLVIAGDRLSIKDLGSLNDYLPQFVAEGYAVFAIDYRGYGHSEGTPTEANSCSTRR